MKQVLLILIVFLFISCTDQTSPELILINGKVYTLQWPDPDLNGNPSPDAPFQNGSWVPEAEAIAITGKLIIKIGTTAEIQSLAGKNTQVIDARGGTIIPGLVDSHTHVINLGQNLELVDLTGVETESEAVALIVEEAKNVPEGEWIIGKGWDEGAWASHYPDKKLLSEQVPNHPVIMRSLHSFATWANQLALDQAGINAETPSPPDGEIVKDDLGVPTGLFLNKGSEIIEAAVPNPTSEQLKNFFLTGLKEMARAGYVEVHEAGVDRKLLAAIMELDKEGKLPIRVYTMLNAEDEELLNEWKEKGPYESQSGMLAVRSVKAFYDGALGSRGALLLVDYSDMPGHQGVSNLGSRFKPEVLKEMANAGFQIAIHAIGDAGNRKTLDFFHQIIDENPEVKTLRNRIEHAQVLHPNDISRFAELGIIASMQPSHAVEDMVWAEDRTGSERIKGAYAWRRLRKAGTHIIFNSDLTGTDHNIFYGLHSAITRMNKNSEPEGGWLSGEAFTPEESLRAFTSWAAVSSFTEDSTGLLGPGRWADITVLNIDPLQTGDSEPSKMLNGKIQTTIVQGKVVFNSK